MSNEQLSDFASGTALLCIIISCVVLPVSWDLYRKRHILKFSRKVNGFRFYPIVGNAIQFLGGTVINNLKMVGDKFNFPIGLWVFHSFTYITIDPAEIKVILNHQHTFDKHSRYKCFEIFFENSLLLAKIDRWKKNRKSFAKCFSQPILHSLVDTFYNRSCIVVQRLKESQSNGLFKVFEKLSFETFCATIMGLAGDDEIIQIELRDLLHGAEKYLESRMITSYFYPDCIAYLTQGGKKFLQDVKRAKDLVAEVVQKKRRAYRNGEVNNDQKQPFFDILLAETLFDEDDIFREIALFVAAATDTPGGTLAFTFTLLGMNPHVQEKIYLEVEKVVGNKGPICYNHLSKLKYTERAILESMRLLPVVPILGRHATADVDLGTKIIPAGSDILISVLHLHRSETYWPNPLEYNPDRFLPEEVAKRHPYSYIPFSAGSRNCIGMKYAMLMMKMTVANVIRNFRITSNYKSVEDMDLTTALSMRTSHELDCVFAPRIQ